MSRLIHRVKKNAILALLALLIATLAMPQTAIAAPGDETTADVAQGVTDNAATAAPEMKMGGGYGNRGR